MNNNATNLKQATKSSKLTHVRTQLEKQNIILTKDELKKAHKLINKHNATVIAISKVIIGGRKS
jgi:membrane protein DedA with SNARE-associated domain